MKLKWSVFKSLFIIIIIAQKGTKHMSISKVITSREFYEMAVKVNQILDKNHHDQNSIEKKNKWKKAKLNGEREKMR